MVGPSGYDPLRSCDSEFTVRYVFHFRHVPIFFNKIKVVDWLESNQRTDRFRACVLPIRRQSKSLQIWPAAPIRSGPRKHDHTSQLSPNLSHTSRGMGK